jgi:protein-tyrosine-phosphatase
MVHTKNSGKIAVICKANAARSIVASNFFQWLYPEFEFCSFGVDVESKSLIPRKTLELLDNWMLPVEKSRTSSVSENLNEILAAKIVFASDEYVYQKLCQYGINPNKIIVVTKINLPYVLKPKDPVGLNLNDFELELAKFIFAMALHISNLIWIESRLEIYTPWFDDSINTVFQDIFKMKISSPYTIFDFSNSRLGKESFKSTSLKIDETYANSKVLPRSLSKDLIGKNLPKPYYKMKPISFKEFSRVLEAISRPEAQSKISQKIKIVVTEPLIQNSKIKIDSLLAASVIKCRVKKNYPPKPYILFNLSDWDK